MYRIFLVFALICLLLAGYLFMQSRELERQFRTLTAEARQVEQNPQTLRKQLRRTRLLTWAAAGGAVLLVVAAGLASRVREGTS
jgi:hypothetical protein